MWILIVIASFDWGGAAFMSQEFNTRAACDQASDIVTSILSDKSHEGFMEPAPWTRRYAVSCVPKGMKHEDPDRQH